MTSGTERNLTFRNLSRVHLTERVVLLSGRSRSELTMRNLASLSVRNLTVSDLGSLTGDTVSTVGRGAVGVRGRGSVGLSSEGEILGLDEKKNENQYRSVHKRGKRNPRITSHSFDPVLVAPSWW